MELLQKLDKKRTPELDADWPTGNSMQPVTMNLLASGLAEMAEEGHALPMSKMA